MGERRPGHVPGEGIEGLVAKFGTEIREPEDSGLQSADEVGDIGRIQLSWARAARSSLRVRMKRPCRALPLTSTNSSRPSGGRTRGPTRADTAARRSPRRRALGDRTAWIWDVTVTELERFRIGHDGKVTGVVFSPNGRLLATASEDHTARISALP